MALNVKEYWENRIQNNSKYRSIGHQAYNEKTNKKRKKSVIPTLNSIINDEFDNPENRSLLDVGCGTGVYSKFYDSLLGDISGIDISQEAIETINDSNISGTFKQGEASDLPFNKEFDIVHCFSVLYHIVDDKKWRRAISEITDKTKDNGIIILRINWTEEGENSAKHVKKRKKPEYKDAFKSEGLKIIKKHDIKDVPLLTGLNCLSD